MDPQADNWSDNSFASYPTRFDSFSAFLSCLWWKLAYLNYLLAKVLPVIRLLNIDAAWRFNSAFHSFI